MNIKDIQFQLKRGETERIWSALSELRYIFSHALLRDAVYEMQLKSRLRELHKLAGDTIERLYPDEKEKYADIAGHFEKAEEWTLAIEWGEKVLKYNESNHVFQEGLKWSWKLDEWLSNQPCSNDRNMRLISVLRATASIQKLLEMSNDFGKSLDRLSVLMSEEESVSSRIWLLENLGEFNSLTGNFEAAKKFYEDAWSLAETAGDDVEKCNILTHFGILYIHTGKPQLAIDHFNRALEIGSAEPDLLPQRGWILNSLGVAEVGIGYLDEALQTYQEALEAHRREGNSIREAITLQNIARIYEVQNNPNKARSFYINAMKIHRELGALVKEGLILVRLGDIALNKRDVEESLAHYKEAERVAERIQNPRLSGFVAEGLGKWHEYQCNSDQALTYYENALVSFQKIANPMKSADLLVEIGLLQCNAGKFEIAMNCHNQILKLLNKTTLKPEMSSSFVHLRSNLIQRGYLDNLKGT